MGIFRRKRTNYGKIIVISIAAVAVASLIAFVIYKLVKKYTDDLVCDCDELLDDCDCEDCTLALDDEEDAVEA